MQSKYTGGLPTSHSFDWVGRGEHRNSVNDEYKWMIFCPNSISTLKMYFPFGELDTWDLF
jgi:hypothetical protein